MRLLRSFPVLAFALVLLSIAGISAAQGSIGLLLVAGTLAALSWYVTEGPRGHTLPRWVANVLVLAVSLNLIVQLWSGRGDAWEALDALGRFVVWLTLIKLYGRKSPKDYGHLLSLSLLLMLTGCIQSSSLLFGVILFAYALLGVYVLLLHQLHRAYEAHREGRRAHAPPDAGFIGTSQPVFGRHEALHFRALTAFVAVAALLLSAVVFVTFPREFGRDSVRVLQAQPRERRTGFATEVNLLTGTRITESHAKVMELRLRDAQGQPVRLDEPLRLRGVVLNAYDRGRWTVDARSGYPVRTEADETRPLAPGAADVPPQYVQHVETYRTGEALFSMAAPLAVTTPHAAALTYIPQTQTLMSTSGEPAPLSYSIAASPAASDAVLAHLTRPASPLVSGGRRHISLRVRSLAHDVLREAGVPLTPPPTREAQYQWNRRVADAMMRHLTSGAYTYTLDLSDVRLTEAHADPVEQFLLSTRRGHCEYFASGFVVMCWSVGAEARLVGGFLAATYDEDGQQYHVLARNAHAWAEAPVGPFRWRTYDPTPPSVLQRFHQTPETVANRLRWMYDGLNSGWTNRIVGFDRSTQGRLVEAIDTTWSTRIDRVVRQVREWMRRVNAAFYFGPAGYLWLSMVGFAVLLAVLSVITVHRRGRQLRQVMHLRRHAGREARRMLRQLGFYAEMLDVLRRARLPKPEWQPPMIYARRLRQRRPDVAAVVRELTELFYRGRFGLAPLQRDDLHRADELLDRLAADLRVKR